MRTLEALEIFEDNLDEIVDAMSENLERDVKELEEEQKILGNVMWHDVNLSDEVRRLTVEQRLGDRIARLKQAIAYRNAKHAPQRRGITNIMIDKAREYPIQELFPGKLHKSGKRMWGCCPFHHEKTPSLCISTHINKFKCFGCDAKGDAIEFYMRANGASFAQAVRKLSSIYG